MNEIYEEGSARSRQKLVAALDTAGREHSNVAVLYHAAVSARMGLSAVEEKALDLLQREGPLSAGRLAELTGLAPPSVTGLINRLERKGFARRVPDTQDKRRIAVEIAPDATERFEPLFAPFGAEMAKLYAGYDDDQLAVILDFLDRSAHIQREAMRALTTQD